jgi:hypothetical protein
MRFAPGTAIIFAGIAWLEAIALFLREWERRH